METCSVVLTLNLLTKSYGVTIQMEPLWQYLCMVPFVLQYYPFFALSEDKGLT